jgi:phosphoglycerol transferase
MSVGASLRFALVSLRSARASRCPAALRAFLEHAGVAVLSSALGVVLLQLWKADLRVPFTYGGDAMPYAMLVKSAVEGGDGLTYPQLGAPGTFELYDYPFALDWAHIAAIKVLGHFVPDWAVVFNSYFLLGFPLISVSAFAVFRHVGISTAPALVGSLLYAFLPSRLIKGEAHLFPDVFYQVPLGILLVLWVCSDEPPLFGARSDSRWPVLDVRRPRSVVALAIGVLLATTGLYYAFFITVLLVAAGIWTSAERRQATHTLAGIALAAVIFAGVVACLAPSWMHQLRHGANPHVGVRVPQEADTFALKIADLLHPVQQHRIGALRRFTARFDAATRPSVPCAEPFGLVGSIGFLTLLAWSFVRGRRERRRPPEPARGSGATSSPPASLRGTLAGLNLAAVLFATTGGFGSLFAWLVSAQIRSYSRMNVVIGFLAFFAIALTLDRLERCRRWISWVTAAAALATGLFDQVTPAAIPPYAEIEAAFHSDGDLVRRIEAGLPARAMVFELPYMTYPESTPLHGMNDYDPLRPALNSRMLRWSYPAMRGGFDDEWIRAAAAQEPDRLVSELSDADFAGILVTRAGYPDKRMELALVRLLGAPDVSADRRLVFFSLRGYEARAHADESPADLQSRRERALQPLLVRWGAGFWELESSPEGPFRWCSSTGEIWLDNRSPSPKHVTMAMQVLAANPPSRLIVAGDLVFDDIPLGDVWVPFSQTFIVPPGEHVVRFRSDGRPADVPGPRMLVWRARNVAIDESPDR